mgnify:CR=1 FL=1
MTVEVMSKSTCEIIEKSIEHYGKELQSIVCMEECAELIQAISKIQRKGLNEELKGHLAEEIADVMICIRMLRMMYGINSADVSKWIDYKIERQANRMKGGK